MPHPPRSYGESIVLLIIFLINIMNKEIQMDYKLLIFILLKKLLSVNLLYSLYLVLVLLLSLNINLSMLLFNSVIDN